MAEVLCLADISRDVWPEQEGKKFPVEQKIEVLRFSAAFNKDLSQFDC